jgi:hypothetical protein
MNMFRKFGRTVDAFAVLVFSTVLAKSLNYRQIERLVSCTEQMTVTASDASSVRRAVERVAWAIPGATCVPQALAAHWMLARRGYKSAIVVGVERNHLDAVAAHAWVVSGDLIVIGGTWRSLERFRVLMTLGGGSP